MIRKLAISAAIVIGSASWVSTPAHALVISTNGSLSSSGAASQIIVAPPNVNDDAAFNNSIQAFNEAVGHSLTANLAVDGGFITAGTRVDSHMIFLNSGPGNSSTLIEHGAGGNQNAASFTFDGLILGVMSTSNGSFEVASSSFLGAAGTIYPLATFSARGMEGDPLDGNKNNDWYALAGSTINLGMRVTEPGDWIRVITVSQASSGPSPVPIPAIFPIFAAVMGLFGFVGWRKRRRAIAVA